MKVHAGEVSERKKESAWREGRSLVSETGRSLATWMRAVRCGIVRDRFALTSNNDDLIPSKNPTGRIKIDVFQATRFN